MGISGLLPLLKSIQTARHIKNWAGKTVGVDVYGWLHKGTISCAIDLALGNPTTKYVDYVMHRVRMLKHYGVTPYLVFDGDYLPSKAGTEAEREKKRAESKVTGLELLKLGRKSQAHIELQKAIDVTPVMARHVIDACTAIGVKCLVAPYEADSQLYYLEKKGIIDAVVSEDSDLLVFGVRTLITKLDQFGECVEINRDHFTACKDISLAGWTSTQFRHMCILSGCDYLDNIPSMGLKTAHRLMRRYHDVEKMLRALKFDGKIKVPEGYLEAFKRADMTFQHQRVFCPIENRLVMANDPDPGTTIDDEILVYIGPDIDVEIARLVASGHLDPMTKQPILIPKATPKASSFRKQWPATSQSRRFETPSNGKTITQFFKPKSEVRPTPSTPLRNKNLNSLASVTSMSAPARPIAAPMSTLTKRPLPINYASDSKKVKLEPSNSASSSTTMTAPAPAPEERSSFFKAQSRRTVTATTPTPKPRIPVAGRENAPPLVSVTATPVAKKETVPATSPLAFSPVFHKSTGRQIPAPRAISPPCEISPEPEDAATKVAQGWKAKYGFSSQDGTDKLSLILERQKQSLATPRMTAFEKVRARALQRRRFDPPVVPSTRTPSMPLLLSSRSMQSSSEESQESEGYVLSADSSQCAGSDVGGSDAPESKGMFDKFALVR